MAIAKQLAPGIHHIGERLHWEGKTTRTLSFEESRSIAEEIAPEFRGFADEIADIQAKIEQLVGLPFHMLAS